MDNKAILKETFQPAIESHFAAFPGSTAHFKTSGLSDKLLYIVTAIFEKELHGCTIHNDPFMTMFNIEQIGTDMYELTIPNGLGLLITPHAEESHLAYSIARLGFRKVKGNAAKILAKIKDVQAKQLSLVNQYRDRIKDYDKSNLSASRNAD